MGASNVQWELEEGIPQQDDPFIQQYLRGRTSLIAEEQKQRHDFTLRKALSPIAATACDIVSKIRDRDLTQHPSGPVETSDLWRILHRMPKGSLLHAHLDTLVDVAFLVDLAFTTPGVCIAAPRPFVVDNDYESALFYFRHCSQSEETEPTLWESSYHPTTLIPLRKAASRFPNGGEPAFREWLKIRFGLRSKSPRSDSAHSAASIVDSLLTYEPILRACLRRIFSQLAADGIKYVEIRNSFDIPFRREGNNEPGDDPFTDWCRVFQEEVNSFKATDAGQTFHGARVIWTTTRISSNRYVFDDMVQCILAKTEFPEVICGFDVVGLDSNRPLTDLVPILFWFRSQCMAEGVDIPFFFHVDERSSGTAQSESDAFDAILLGTRRIGNGLSLYRHPLLLDLTKEKKILLECYPKSESDTQSVPLSTLLARGASVALCNHVPSACTESTNTMTSRFWKTLESEHLSLTDLAMIAENSVRWSCFTDQPTKEWLSELREGILGEGTKATRLKEWYSEFEKFCEWVALEFAEVGIED